MKKVMQAQQLIAGADQAVETRFFQPQRVEEIFCGLGAGIWAISSLDLGGNHHAVRALLLAISWPGPKSHCPTRRWLPRH